MSGKKGLTLIEIVAVMVIVGILAALALPNYITMVQQGAAKAAQNNLITIYNAQKNYYYTNNAYCVSSAGICNSNLSTNSTLQLNITDPNFTYTCNASGSTYVCYATNNADANFLLTLASTPIVLTGGAGCATSTGASCNPICQSDVNGNCP